MQLTIEQFMNEIEQRSKPLTYTYECFDDNGVQLTHCQSVVTSVKLKPERNTLSLIGSKNNSTWLMQVISIDELRCIEKTTENQTFTYRLLVDHNSHVVLKMDFYRQGIVKDKNL